MASNWREELLKCCLWVRMKLMTVLLWCSPPPLPGKSSLAKSLNFKGYWIARREVRLSLDEDRGCVKTSTPLERRSFSQSGGGRIVCILPFELLRIQPKTPKGKGYLAYLPKEAIKVSRVCYSTTHTTRRNLKFSARSDLLLVLLQLLL